MREKISNLIKIVTKVSLFNKPNEKNPKEPQGYLKYIPINVLSTVNWFICIFH